MGGLIEVRESETQYWIGETAGPGDLKVVGDPLVAWKAPILGLCEASLERHGMWVNVTPGGRRREPSKYGSKILACRVIGDERMREAEPPNRGGGV